MPLSSSQSPPPNYRSSSRRGWVIALVALLSAAALGIGGYLLYHQLSKKTPSSATDCPTSSDPISSDPTATTNPACAIVQTVKVPNVLNLTLEQAVAAIKAVAPGTLLPDAQPVPKAGFGDNVVYSQNPGADTPIPANGKVSFQYNPAKAPVVIPDGLIGQPEVNVEAALSKLGLTVKQVPTASDTVPKDLVISTDPASGASVSPGTVVNVAVSIGKAQATVPNVLNEPEAQARADLTAAGFVVVAPSTQENSDTIAAGNATRTDPAAGSSLERGQNVTLFVSSGSQPTVVPPLVGLSESQARDALQLANLKVKVVSAIIAFGDPKVNKVISQDATAGASIAKGTVVTIVVGQAGPPPTPAPTTTTTTTTTVAPTTAAPTTPRTT